MKLVRFNGDRLGVVEGDQVVDVSSVLDALPSMRWPVPLGDALIRALPELRPGIAEAARSGASYPLAEVRLESPVANPSKIIAAPVNYKLHLDEGREDAGIHFGSHVKPIEEAGLFLKANSSLVGVSEGVALPHLDRRMDHEVELAAVIGRGGRDIPRERALEHVAGYAIGLDMTVRGPEDRSFRKSYDSFTVLGPWLVTADEIADPGNLDFWIKVNGEDRQRSNTSLLIFDLPRLIEFASAVYTLLPGDIILTGTPEGVAPVEPGDTMTAWVQGVGEMQVAVRRR